MRAWLDAAPTRVDRWALLLGFGLLVAIRMPAALTIGRFWAEEGAVYLRNALLMPWPAALGAVENSYVNLIGNAATLLAAQVPLRWAPLLTGWIALGFQSCAAILLVWGRQPWLERRWVMGGAVGMLATSPYGSEVWLNTITSQFHLALCVGLILAFDLPRGTAGIFRGALLALAPLTAPAAAFLAPLFLVRAAAERNAARLRQSVPLLVGSTIQAAIVLSTPIEGRGVLLAPSLLLTILASKHLVYPLAGTRIAATLDPQLVATVRNGSVPWPAVFAPMLAFGTLFTGAWRAGEKSLPWLVLAALVLALGSYASAYTQGHPLTQLTTGGGMRYGFAPGVLGGLAVLGVLATADRWPARILCAAILLALAVNGAHAVFWTGTFGRGPDWPAALARWRHGDTPGIEVWPGGQPWFVPIRPPA